MSLSSHSASLSLIYLFRVGHALEEMDRFLRRVRESHLMDGCRIVILLKGEFKPAQENDIEAILKEAARSFDLDILRVSDDGVDITALYQAVLSCQTEYFCFCNTYSEPLERDWLNKLSAPVLQGHAVISGASGSYETTLAETSFPNPALRTNAICMSREHYLSLSGNQPLNREEALRFETGVDSMTAQTLRRGERVVVVNSDGDVFDIDEAHLSQTFRPLGKAKLLVHDNRTRAYEEADENLKRKLRRFAWGEGKKPKNLGRWLRDLLPLREK